MEKQREIPQVDIPDEITQVDRPEISEETHHPDTPQPQANSKNINQTSNVTLL